MLALLFFACMLVAGRELANRLWRLDPPGTVANPSEGAAAVDSPRPAAPDPLERLASIGLLAIAITLALDWAAALSHGFTPWILGAAAIALVALSARGLRSLTAGLDTTYRPTPSFVCVALAIFAVGVWAGFVVWRDSVVFPYASDALAYHLPKALYIARTHSFALFDASDVRLTTFPCDYEMLVANVFAFDRSHTLIGAVDAILYLQLMLVVAALVGRWWPGDSHVHVAGTVLLVAAMPILLLVSGAHKNDVLLTLAIMGAALWGARWGTSGSRASLALLLISACVAVGTKPTAGILPLAVLPAAIVRARAWRASGTRVSAREIATWVVAAVASILLLGGVAYFANLATYHLPLGIIPGSGYGDWAHVWKFSYLVFARPLSPVDASWVPWRHEYWFWPEWDLFFSTFGLPATLALLATPFAVARYGRRGRAAERWLATAALVVVFLFVLPVRSPGPLGLSDGAVRYTFFLPPILFAWTVAPLLQELSASRKRCRWAIALVVGLAILCGKSAVTAAARDTYVPFDFVVDVSNDPDLDRTIRTWTVRAATWVDRNAGPDDVIAVDASFDGWVYPAFGKDLRRELVYLHSDRGQVTIPDAAKWVIIDRSWHCVFGHPDFRTTALADWGAHIFKGGPAPSDMVVFHQLFHDPRFSLVYRDKTTNQAVFVRTSMVHAPGS